jgi:hypothetical protein
MTEIDLKACKPILDMIKECSAEALIIPEALEQHPEQELIAQAQTMLLNRLASTLLEKGVLKFYKHQDEACLHILASIAVIEDEEALRELLPDEPEPSRSDGDTPTTVAWASASTFFGPGTSGPV